MLFSENDINGKVVEFENGDDAWNYPHEFTIFLLGCEMPEMNGISAMRQFRYACIGICRYGRCGVGIDSREILYTKTEPPYWQLFLENGTSRSLRVSLNYLEDKLKGVDFGRVHRSYLVNFMYVERMQDNAICAQRKTLPVSSRRYAGIRKSYEKFCLESARREKRNEPLILT